MIDNGIEFKNAIKLDKSLYNFMVDIEIESSFAGSVKCILFEISDKKIAIDKTRIDVFNNFDDWNKGIGHVRSDNLYYIKDLNILGFSDEIDDLFPGDSCYIFTVDNQMNEKYYEDCLTEWPNNSDKTILHLISSISLTDFEIISKANLSCLNSILYWQKKANKVKILFDVMEDLPVEGWFEEFGVEDHNELWEVIDENEIRDIANYYFLEN